MTHSLEVAQIASGIVQNLQAASVPEAVSELLPPTPLISAIGLAHDLGHPPYGHGGEVALNYCMRHDGGFEGNAQTLRILTRLESFSEKDGADLTRRSLLGVLKYPAPFSRLTDATLTPQLLAGPSSFAVLDLAACKPPKAIFDEEHEVLNWILEPFCEADRERFVSIRPGDGGHDRTIHKSLDSSIMDAADEIAYGVHDLEDAITLGFITENDFRGSIDAETARPFLEALQSRPLVGDQDGGYDGFVERLFGRTNERKGAIGRLVHFFIRSVDVERNEEFSDPLLQWRATIADESHAFLKALQGLIVKEVIDSPQVQHLEFKGQRMVVAVFEALMTDPRRLLPRDVWEAFAKSERSPRVICDYVASLTDTALLRTYDRLFSPRSGSVFDRI